MIAIATVLGAALLFLIQPLVGKSLLPYHGGAPAAWATCLAFFQLALLVGYAQAHGIARRRQVLALCGIEVAVAVGLLVHSALVRGGPLVPGEDPGAGPIALLLELARLAGLPVVLLATASPLLQASFASRGYAPWRLYAASNAASLVALVAFPFVLEPTCSLATLRWAWAGAFGAWTLVAAIAVARHAVAPETGPAENVTVRDALRWTGWAALGAGLLVATSQHLGQEIAVTPALMVAPLAVYLAAFAVAFAEAAWARVVVRAAAPLVPIAIVLVATAMRRADDLGPVPLAAIPLVALLAGALHAHGALVRSRPSPARLEAFYLAIAAGGAAGGLGVAFASPWLLPAALEFPALLLVCAWLVAVDLFCATPRGPAARVHPRWAVLALFAAAMSLAAVGEGRANAVLRAHWPDADWRIPYLVAGAIAILALEGLRLLPRGASLRPDRPGWRVVAVAMLLVVVHAVTIEPWVVYLREPRAVSRGYFGTLRVVDRQIGPHRARMLYHGAVRHGLARLDVAGRDEPGSYYGRDAGLGRVLAARRAHGAGAPLCIGAIGLGVGAVAQLAAQGDRVTFVELDPRVRDLAEGEGGHFDVVARARARGVAVDIVVGDGRVELARRDQACYDVLVVDAFSGGVIPTHLLTREAFALYASRLRNRHGVIVVHLSSQHFDLRPVVAGAARALGLATAYAAAPGDVVGATDASLWMALSADPTILDDAGVTALAAEVPEAVGGVREWTDDWSSLVGLAWRR